jgi:hypothetical protein
MLVRKHAQQQMMGGYKRQHLWFGSRRGLHTTTGINLNLSLTLPNADYAARCRYLFKAIQYLQARQPRGKTAIWNTHFGDSNQLEQMKIIADLAHEFGVAIEQNTIVSVSRLETLSPQTYFQKLLRSGIDISKLLLVGEKSDGPKKICDLLRFVKGEFPGIQLGTTIDYKGYSSQETQEFVKFYREEAWIDFMVSHIVVDLEDVAMLAEACTNVGLYLAVPFVGNGDYFRRLESGAYRNLITSEIVTTDKIARNKNYAITREREVDSVLIDVSPQELLRRQARVLAKLKQRYPQLEIWLRCMSNEESLYMLHMLALGHNDEVVPWPILGSSIDDGNIERALQAYHGPDSLM